MTTAEVCLLEKFIDAKLQRLLMATRVAMADMDGPEIMALMLPIETELETLRTSLLKP